MKKAVLSFTGFMSLLTIGWFASIELDKSGNADTSVSGYHRPGQIQYSFTLQNKTNRVIPKAEFWTYAPVNKTATQKCVNIQANQPYAAATDSIGNQVLRFALRNIAPYASRIISLKVDLMLANHPQPLPGRPSPKTLKPERFVESDHPAIKKQALQLKKADHLTSAEVIFRWVVTHVSFTGYDSKARGALYTLKHKKGDCTEYMDLFVALCRAAGTPARRISGYVCPQNTILRPQDLHNWAEFYQDGRWHTADPQNNVWMPEKSNYIAMNVIQPSSGKEPSFTRFRFEGVGLKVQMN
jgi:transglutaminase-like putative cysteine protease